jgi:hypothetical protein
MTAMSGIDPTTAEGALPPDPVAGIDNPAERGEITAPMLGDQRPPRAGGERFEFFNDECVHGI